MTSILSVSEIVQKMTPERNRATDRNLRDCDERNGEAETGGVGSALEASAVVRIFCELLKALGVDQMLKVKSI